MSFIHRCFFEHPERLGETYQEHFKCASRIAIETAKISGIIMVHAIFPMLYEFEAGDRIEKLNKEIQERKRRNG